MTRLVNQHGAVFWGRWVYLREDLTRAGWMLELAPAKGAEPLWWIPADCANHFTPA